METQDILFQEKGSIFSYRVAGILIRDGKVLLQHPIQDPAYSFPGGHVRFDETSTDALVREIREETGATIAPERLLWLGENFFPIDEKECHQICFYFSMRLMDETQIPLQGNFMAQKTFEGKASNVEFCWLDFQDLKNIALYPIQAREKLLQQNEMIEHFVYIE